METSRRTAIVIGCGIAGPVTAMALQRVGIEPVIYEAHEGSAAYVGSFLNTASNGLRALRSIGVAPERLRRERVERVVRYSRRIGNTKVPGPLGRGFRDFFMPLALRVFANSRMNDWLYRYPPTEVQAS